MTATRRIAFQGVPGAYSHLACRLVHPELEAVGYHTFDEVFAAIEEDEVEMGMIPIENTLGGRVADIHHLLPESSLYIVGEFFLPIRHQLLAPHGATLDSLRTVASHEQGLAQCRGLIRELGLEAVDFGDTAGAAKDVAEKADPSMAAIASELAAEIYGLEVLRSRIEDRLDNTTRFVIMSRRAVDPDPRDGPCITSLVFQIRSVPGALYKSLGGFATNGINILKLESYMIDASFTVAQFYAEFEGHPSEVPVAHALDELQFFCSKLKRLGTYPAHEFRRL